MTMASHMCINGRRPWLSKPFTCLSTPASTARRASTRPVRHVSAPQTTKKHASRSDVFSLSDIPLSSLERVIARNGDEFQQLKPHEYYSCVQRFAQRIQQGSDPWSTSLTGKDGFPPDLVHSTACILRQIQGPRSADAFATALWTSASDAGYRPSTLSLARQLIRSGAFGRVPQLSKVEARFKQLVSTARDPDALTAQGELLLGQGNHEAAIRVLERALHVAGAAGFEWKPYCQLCLAKAYLRTQRRDEGIILLESLAESGLVEAHVELGNALLCGGASGGGDKEMTTITRAEEHLFFAACSGRPDLFSRLAEIAVDKAAAVSDDKGRRDKEEFLRWAGEWSRLADPRAEY